MFALLFGCKQNEKICHWSLNRETGYINWSILSPSTAKSTVWRAPTAKQSLGMFWDGGRNNSQKITLGFCYKFLGISCKICVNMKTDEITIFFQCVLKYTLTLEQIPFLANMIKNTLLSPKKTPKLSKSDLSTPHPAPKIVSAIRDKQIFYKWSSFQITVTEECA